MGSGRGAECGFDGVVVACEPTGHRWRVVAELCDTLGVRLVWVQPMLVHRAREAEDFTRDKSDDKDAVLIARLAAELRCYLPEPTDAGWARLRPLGARRAQLTTQVGAARQQLRDLLECAWPAVLAAAADPLDSVTWRAAVTVTLARTGTDPAGLRRLGYARFARAVTVELGRWVASAAATGSWVRSGPPPPTRPSSGSGWPPSGRVRWNGPRWSWATGTTPWASSPRSRSAWSACSTPSSSPPSSVRSPA
jgi:transposase